MTQDFPIISQSGGTYYFRWLELGVEAVVRRIRVVYGYTNAEVTWYSTSPGEKGHLHQGILRLLDPRSKNETVRALRNRHKDKDWVAVVEQLTVRTLEMHRQGEPAVLLGTSAEAAAPIPLAIAPLFYEGQPFILYGEPGTAKSYLAMLTLVAGVTGGSLPGIPFRAMRSYTGIYLDWESTQQDQQQRLRRLSKGMGVDVDSRIHYRYCSAPLSADLDQIQAILLETESDLLVIDSLGPAAGGDLNSAQSAQEFFSALRSLKCTSIILAHCSKNGDPNRRTVFGSQFFTALTRGTAEVKRYQEAGEDEISVGIFHRKSNVSRLHKPFGVRLLFDSDAESVSVRHQDIRKVPELSASQPVGAQIIDVLASARQPLRPAEISDCLTDVASGTVRKALKRLVDSERVTKLGDGRYGAAVQEDDLAPF